MQEDRRKRAEQGLNLARSPWLWGQQIDATWLSNTHSFMVSLALRSVIPVDERQTERPLFGQRVSPNSGAAGLRFGE